MVVHAYYPLGETRVEREARALVDRGFEVDVVCLSIPGEPPYEEADGVAIYRLPMRRRKGRGRLYQLLEYLIFFVRAGIKLAVLHRRRHYGCVQAHNLPDFLVFAALIPKLGGARVILDIHDLMPEFFAASAVRGMRAWPVRLLLWEEQLSCAFADHIITVSEPWRDVLVSRGVSPEKISVVMNVADAAIFHREARLASQPRANGSFCLVYHGQITQRYGIDLLLHAIDRLRRDIPELRLLIHGGGDYLDALRRLTAQLALDEHVEISTNFMLTPELPVYLLQADAGVVPYRNDVFTGGILPTKLMEYTALGIPAIAARTPGIAAYFAEDMVEFFEPGDVEGLAKCILRLYHEPSRRSDLVRASDRFNQQHTWAGVSADYAALIDRIHRR